MEYFHIFNSFTYNRNKFVNTIYTILKLLIIKNMGAIKFRKRVTVARSISYLPYYLIYAIEHEIRGLNDGT